MRIKIRASVDEMWKKVEEWQHAAEASMIGMEWPTKQPQRSSGSDNLTDEEKKAILTKVVRAALRRAQQGKDSQIISFKESGKTGSQNILYLSNFIF